MPGISKALFQPNFYLHPWAPVFFFYKMPCLPKLKWALDLFTRWPHYKMNKKKTFCSGLKATHSVWEIRWGIETWERRGAWYQEPTNKLIQITLATQILLEKSGKICWQCWFWSPDHPVIRSSGHPSTKERWFSAVSNDPDASRAGPCRALQCFALKIGSIGSENWSVVIPPSFHRNGIR